MKNGTTFSADALRQYENVLDEYVITLLSGDRTQNGYNPIGRQNRLKEKYKNQWKLVQLIVESFIQCMEFLVPHWDKENYGQFESRIRNELRTKYPFLSIEASNQIVNFVLFNHK